MRPITTQSHVYEFHVRGELSDAVLAGFAGLQAEPRRGDTVLTGEVQDQAALFGVLHQIQALGIHLVEVRRVDPVSQPRD